ncbi:hypothetical protein CAPTEDRAFT_214139 [Capitella teleta]|uniref:Uncharacterized protein n=1 Tax=Capitella teleta TaxID=283909 RepID=R7TK04_CAPTE|nr:hypothetical protein CAPTEDRAFT_214139 [Capitella teleta]|eukprot:ELT94163.1 hypothetical protein CAPTEDRAFT_214139 [Capitella teleta]
MAQCDQRTVMPMKRFEDEGMNAMFQLVDQDYVDIADLIRSAVPLNGMIYTYEEKKEIDEKEEERKKKKKEGEMADNASEGEMDEYDEDMWEECSDEEEEIEEGETQQREARGAGKEEMYEACVCTYEVVEVVHDGGFVVAGLRLLSEEKL